MSAGSQGGLPPASVPMRDADQGRRALGAGGARAVLPAPRLPHRQNISNKPSSMRARTSSRSFVHRRVRRPAAVAPATAHPQRPRRVLFPPLDAFRTIIRRGCRAPGLPLLLIFPWLALALTGQAGAIKWIDNFGIQILIYMMLGWGLNIVVGLAGLLDLGYVAFYAVGAYTYAIIATYVIPATVPVLGPWASGSACRSPASSRPSGASCSAFRCCGCAATISPSSRWRSARSSASCSSTGCALTNGYAGISAFRASPSSACRSHAHRRDGFADILRPAEFADRPPHRSSSST